MDWVTEWMIDRVIKWLSDDRLSDWLIDWVIERMIDWVIMWIRVTERECVTE